MTNTEYDIELDDLVEDMRLAEAVASAARAKATRMLNGTDPRDWCDREDYERYVRTFQSLDVWAQSATCVRATVHMEARPAFDGSTIFYNAHIPSDALDVDPDEVAMVEGLLSPKGEAVIEEIGKGYWQLTWT